MCDPGYGAEAVDTGGFLADHLLVAHFAAGPRSQELRCSRGHCACSVVLPDFRFASHVSHSRTERALQLASQHVVAGAAVLVLPELSSSHAPHGAIVCG